MAEKTESVYYKLESLVRYDDECRDTANEKGLGSFGEIKPLTVLKFLSYDNTSAAKKQGGQSGPVASKKIGQKGFCFAFNSQSGCHGAGCAFRHTCMFFCFFLFF